MDDDVEASDLVGTDNPDRDEYVAQIADQAEGETHADLEDMPTEPYDVRTFEGELAAWAQANGYASDERGYPLNSQGLPLIPSDLNEKFEEERERKQAEKSAAEHKANRPGAGNTHSRSKA